MSNDKQAKRSLGKVTYFVLDHDEAITFFVTKLGFELVEDTKISETKRWVHIRAGCEGAGMVLALASEARKEFVYNQAAGKVFGFLETDDFMRDYNNWSKLGVQFLETPRDEEYGIVSVFLDLYQNRWDLIQRKM
jgi:catechol 2,3-dioxygenase-like lactoylglutathione lyase family enzyme